MSVMEEITLLLLLAGSPILMSIVWAILDWKQGYRGFQLSWACAVAYLALPGIFFGMPSSPWPMFFSAVGGGVFANFAGMLAAIVNHFRRA